MENQLEEYTDFDSTVDSLFAMFGNVISKEVISVVLETCGGNLNFAADTIMNMSNEFATPSEVLESTHDIHHTTLPTSEVKVDEMFDIPCSQQSVSISEVNLPQSTQPAMSYAAAWNSTGAVPKQLPKVTSIEPLPFVPAQISQIVACYNQGSRILIFMRGASGSGKSYLAREILDMTVGNTYSAYKSHIFSTDDYFMVRNKYEYNRSKLSEAHEWNQNRARTALRQGRSPVIIDNTNIEVWEMEPYLREGVRNGYIVEVVEPYTPWAKKASQLIKKSTHKVPPDTIKRMLNKFISVTGEQLRKQYGLTYPTHMVPPVLRKIPTFTPPDICIPTSNEPVVQNEVTDLIVFPSTSAADEKEFKVRNLLPHFTVGTLQQSEQITPVIENVVEDEESSKNKRLLEIQKQLEEMEKFEHEWEHGESWGEELQENKDIDVVKPLPSRQEESKSTGDKLLENIPNCNDWSKISMFMPSWNELSTTSSTLLSVSPPKDVKCSSTCVEIGDTNVNNQTKLKIVTATPRDINLFYTPLEKEKIPQKRMLDKSTMTNEFLIMEAYRCPYVEQHFVAFRKLFKNYSKAALRDIFDKCYGDVNWAVDIVIGDITLNRLKVKEVECDSDEDVEIQEQCNCMAEYDILPGTNPISLIESGKSTAILENVPLKSIDTHKANCRKKKTGQSESSLQLKRDIEKNFVLGDNQYSPQVLKIKKWRYGEYLDEDSELNVPNEEVDDTSNLTLEALAIDNKIDECQEYGQQTKDYATNLSDDEESNTSSMEDIEKTININLGSEFVSQLDTLFGRGGMTYPKNVVPRINIPISLLNEINAFWVESLMCQLDEQDKQNARMLREDEDFARLLEIKEQELAQQGREPEVPDFKEIMDMDFAMSLYQKDVAEWRNKESNDIAAKMSREKLFNLFPDVSQDILSELLMAHDNDFLATVEGLLVSTGRANIVENQNGLNKFIMEREIERKEKFLEDEKKALSQVEWPLLPKGEKVEMTTVNEYREEADKHLARRNLNYQKAQDYIRRGMTQVANYYSDIASFHKRKYEQANSLAAASLMQVHANNCPDNATIDLHYLRVGEAKESLDLFIDSHIQKLRESANKAVKNHTLFLITGRGLHSNGRPRVKPAVKRRLRERGIAFYERNPGLLTAKVCAEDKLSYQVQP